jgi:sugar/nucleoside kinase (ribokinase family)
MASPANLARESVHPVRLLAVGDIAWDVVVRPAGDLVWGSDVYGSTDLYPGGSSANVAVWARRMGAEVVLVGKIGDDPWGRLMHEHLAAEGVADRVQVSTAAETTRVSIVIRPDGEHAFVTDHSRPLRLTADDLPLSLLDGADAIFLNGYAVFMAGGAGFAQALLEEARRRRVSIVFDPSSFTLVRRYGGTRLLRELGALDVLVGNEEELEALADGRGIESLMPQAGLVVVKQGPRGATALQAVSPVRRYAAPAIAIDVRDTTGAGDAFDAAFIAEYFNHGDIDRALAAANRLGGLVAGRLGAQTQA